MDKACETMNELDFETQSKINDGLPALGDFVDQSLRKIAGQQVGFAILVFPGPATQGTSNLCEHHLMEQLLLAIQAMSDSGNIAATIAAGIPPADSGGSSLH